MKGRRKVSRKKVARKKIARKKVTPSNPTLLDQEYKRVKAMFKEAGARYVGYIPKEIPPAECSCTPTWPSLVTARVSVTRASAPLRRQNPSTNSCLVHADGQACRTTPTLGSWPPGVARSALLVSVGGPAPPRASVR